MSLQRCAHQGQQLGQSRANQRTATLQVQNRIVRLERQCECCRRGGYSAVPLQTAVTRYFLVWHCHRGGQWGRLLSESVAVALGCLLLLGQVAAALPPQVDRQTYEATLGRGFDALAGALQEKNRQMDAVKDSFQQYADKVDELNLDEFLKIWDRQMCRLIPQDQFSVGQSIPKAISLKVQTVLPRMQLYARGNITTFEEGAERYIRQELYETEKQVFDLTYRIDELDTKLHTLSASLVQLQEYVKTTEKESLDQINGFMESSRVAFDKQVQELMFANRANLHDLRDRDQSVVNEKKLAEVHFQNRMDGVASQFREKGVAIVDLSRIWPDSHPGDLIKAFLHTVAQNDPSWKILPIFVTNPGPKRTSANVDVRYTLIPPLESLQAIVKEGVRSGGPTSDGSAHGVLQIDSLSMTSWWTTKYDIIPKNVMYPSLRNALFARRDQYGLHFETLFSLVNSTSFSTPPNCKVVFAFLGNRGLVIPPVAGTIQTPASLFRSAAGLAERLRDVIVPPEFGDFKNRLEQELRFAWVVRQLRQDRRCTLYQLGLELVVVSGELPLFRLPMTPFLRDSIVYIRIELEEGDKSPPLDEALQMAFTHASPEPSNPGDSGSDPGYLGGGKYAVIRTSNGDVSISLSADDETPTILGVFPYGEKSLITYEKGRLLEGICSHVTTRMLSNIFPNSFHPYLRGRLVVVHVCRLGKCIVS
eukprot:GHVT01043746.1.p1 GENE.GHVT01043746.1~~GHVT01043746.1.p1  ORF type:complete len:704 (+),score=36.47 GHVT01043746.1:1986-4097(+)